MIAHVYVLHVILRNNANVNAFCVFCSIFVYAFFSKEKGHHLKETMMLYFINAKKKIPPPPLIPFSTNPTRKISK